MLYTQRESQVRKAKPTDACEILKIFRNSSSPTFLRYSIFRSPLSENYLLSCLKSSITDWNIFVAEQNDEALGAYIAKKHSEGWFLNYIAVSTLAESRGIGGKLLEHFEQEGRHRLEKRAVLDVFENNSKAINWYFANKYKITKRSFFVAISIDKSAVLKAPDLVLNDKEMNRALEEEQKQGFSNVNALCNKGSIKAGLIGGDTLRLISWEGISLSEAINAAISRLGKSRKELIILGIPQIPPNYSLTSEVSFRLSKEL